MARKKTKNQSVPAQTKELSDHRVQASPDKTKGRGIGSSFAFAVGSVMQSAPNIKGSQTDFLGEPSEIISVSEMTRLVQGK